jgi:light-regulated signal transduction histidine kinase (bacteriophytochrome)
VTAPPSRFAVSERTAERFAAPVSVPSGQIGASTDVTACDTEPIHIPGSVQPHGALLALDEASLAVRRISSNAARFLGSPPEHLLGAPLARALGPDVARTVLEAVRATPSGRIGPLVRDLTGLDGELVVVRSCDLTLHRNDAGVLILEIEEHLPARDLGTADFPTRLLRLQAAPDLPDLLRRTVDEVAELTGFDRVMFYRFNAEGDGEVVAERIRSGDESYQGLHYPGSDIPRQARELYRRQWLRLITDSAYEPSPLLPPDGPGTPPLDLSHAALRSVSPVHVQYLRNMGVGASMSMSVVVEDELWGLILCHGTQAHPVSSRLRTACEQIAQFVSMQVAARWDTSRLSADLRSQHLRTLLMDQIDHPDPAAGLFRTGSAAESERVDLRDLVPADGAAGRLAGQTVVGGDLLDPPTADALVRLLRSSEGWDGYYTGCLRRDCPHAADLLIAAGHPSIAGVLLAPALDATSEDYLLWVRREVEQTVNWAGEPTVKHQSGTLSPRASFALWREKVRDQSEAWQYADVGGAATLAAAVAARLTRLEEMALAAAAARAEQLFQREHEIADALQRGMLPTLPELDGVTLSASYLSASESAEVGGDWYDVFMLPDGSIGLAMGDVTGHDLSAAAAMGQLRSVLRSYAWEEPAPEQVLDKVDALVAGFAMRHLATVFFGRIEAAPGHDADGDGDAGGGSVLRYANAGHLPPLLRLPDGTVEVLDDGVSVLIGVGVDIPHEAASRPLPPGSTLLLYTDGLVERRDRGLDEGVELLRTVVASGPAEPDELREHVLAQLAPGRREDDIAVLAVRLDG